MVSICVESGSRGASGTGVESAGLFNGVGSFSKLFELRGTDDFGVAVVAGTAFGHVRRRRFRLGPPTNLNSRGAFTSAWDIVEIRRDRGERWSIGTD